MTGGGQWGLCGGKPKDGEPWEVATKRELQEETSLTCETFRQVGWVDYVDRDGHMWLTLFVEALDVRGKMVNMEPHKCSSYGWFSLQDLPRPVFTPLLTFVEENMDLTAPQRITANGSHQSGTSDVGTEGQERRDGASEPVAGR